MRRRLITSFPVRVVKRYLDVQGPNWGTLIAWNALFAFFPIILVAITVLGLVLQDPGVKHNLETQIAAAFPDCRRQMADGGHCDIIDALDGFRQKTGLTGIIGFVGLLWGGSALFGAMDGGLSALYCCKSRDFLPQKLMSVGMILLFTILTLPLMLSGSLLSFLERLPVVPHMLRTGSASLLIQIGLGIVDASVLFTAIYKVVPNRHLRLRRVLPGALVAACLFEGFTLVFPLYFRISGGFARYGQTFALFFILLFYFFVLGQIVMLGGTWNAERDPEIRAMEQREREERERAGAGEVAIVGRPVGEARGG